MSRPTVVAGRLAGLACVAGFAILAAVLATIGEIAASEAAAATAAIAVGVGVPALASPHGWRRRLAELAVLPPAWALAMLSDPLMRRAATAPLLVAAAVAAAAAAWRGTGAPRRPLLAAALGVACRASVGVGAVGDPAAAALALAASGFAPAGVARWWPAAGIPAALVCGLVPLRSAPWTAAGLAVGGLALVVARHRAAIRAAPRGWVAGVAGTALAAATVLPFGGAPSGPWATGPTAVAAVVAVAATAWLPAAPAGAIWFLLPQLAASPVAPPPDHAAFRLEAGAPPAVLWPARGPRYGLDLALTNAARVADGTPVARLETRLGTTVLRAGEHAAEAAHARPDVRAVVAHRMPERPVWRPAGWGGEVPWRVAGRTTVAVADGERPVLVRDPALDPRVGLVVETGGPAAPTAPRSWGLAAWLWAAAGAVLALQLLAGTWRHAAGAAPWVVLVAGAWIVRLPIEPVRLLGERFAVDLALAALLAAWLPAAGRWLGRGRVALAAAALLVPLALATPRLTPPLYGDEPFHLRVMQSLVEDRDLDLADDIADVPAERRYQDDGRLFHSPALGVVLLPFWMACGRTGALVALALAAAATAALVTRRARQLGVPASRVGLLAGALLLTYPLATYATQIWPEVPGALAVAVLLAFGADRPVAGAAAAALAVAVKARLALVTLPVLLAAWWRRWPRRPAALLAGAAAAAAVGLAVGWATMGHPFGFYRRLHHLLPSDPVQPARVLAGLVVDAAGGLALSSPLLLLGACGFGLLWRRGGPGERGLLVGVAATLAALLHSLEWYGGGAPPARYLVPALPAFALGLAMLLWRPVRWRGWGWLLAVPSVAVWWVLVTRPHLSVNPGDGGWWATTALARRLAADTRWLTPSLLVPGTAAWVAVVVVVVAVVAGARAARRSRAVSRAAVGVWLGVAALAVGATALRSDRVVELEAAQVRRWGGSPEPPAGRPSRFTVPNGWRLGDGDRVEIPLRLPPDAAVVLEGWLAGPAKAGVVLHVRWDEGPELARPVRGRRRDARLELPGDPGPGRHRLSIRLEAPRGGVAILDRVVVEE